MSSEPSKLIELRRKTDRELPLVILRELERGLTLASVAATRSSPFRREADRIYSKMRSLLDAIDGLGPAARIQLDSKLNELRAALDLSEKRMVRQPACVMQGD